MSLIKGAKKNKMAKKEYSEGFISLYRKMINWEWYDDIPVFRLFIHLLLTVNWAESKWHGINIKPGQTITSRKHLAEKTGLSEQQVRTALKKLQKTRRNNQQSNQQFYSYNH